MALKYFKQQSTGDINWILSIGRSATYDCDYVTYINLTGAYENYTVDKPLVITQDKSTILDLYDVGEIVPINRESLACTYKTQEPQSIISMVYENPSHINIKILDRYGNTSEISSNILQSPLEFIITEKDNNDNPSSLFHY